MGTIFRKITKGNENPISDFKKVRDVLDQGCVEVTRC